VASGRADVGVFVPPQHEAALACRPYREGTLAALVPQGHVLLRRGAVDFEALLDFDIVGLHLGAAANELMRERAQALGRTLNERIQVRGFEAIAQLVETGLGVAILPAVVAERASRVFGVVALPLNEDWARRQYLLAVRPQPVLPTVLQRFIDTLSPPATSPPSQAAVPSDAKPPARQSRPRPRKQP
jgi:DNA-binding transcriptional LysR family regulator